MADILYHDKERVLLSVIVALIIHIVFFIGLHFILNIQIPPAPEYSGPLYLELGPEFSEPVITKELITEDNKEQEPEEETKKDREETSTEKTDTSRVPVKDKDSEKQPDREKKPIPEEPKPEEKELSDDTTDTSPDSADENLLSNNEVPRETPQKTPEVTSSPGKTPQPSRPALEEESLSQLDELLDNGTTGEKDTGHTTGETTSENETSPTEGGGPVFEWEDNRDRSPLHTYKPDIPSWVSEQGLRLIIEVSFLLSPDGFLTSLRIEKSSGYTEIDSLIEDALRKWKFPSVSGKKSVSGRITYVVGIK